MKRRLNETDTQKLEVSSQPPNKRRKLPTLNDPNQSNEVKPTLSDKMQNILNKMKSIEKNYDESNEAIYDDAVDIARHFNEFFAANVCDRNTLLKQIGINNSEFQSVYRTPASSVHIKCYHWFEKLRIASKESKTEKRLKNEKEYPNGIILSISNTNTNTITIENEYKTNDNNKPIIRSQQLYECRKCGKSGHWSTECTSDETKKKVTDLTERYGDKCFKCGKSGHWASECMGEYGVKNKCGKCGNSDHYTRDCGINTNTTNTNTTENEYDANNKNKPIIRGQQLYEQYGDECRKCGKSGHWASECTEYGVKDRNKYDQYGDKCFKCGESGHWASECTQSGAKSKCGKCGQSDHYTRDCGINGNNGNNGNNENKGNNGNRGNKADGDGYACFKCGKYGHWARECTQY